MHYTYLTNGCRIDLPSLKSAAYLKIDSYGDINCANLAKRFSKLTFTPGKADPHKGFTCWAGYDNKYDASDSEGGKQK